MARVAGITAVSLTERIDRSDPGSLAAALARNGAVAAARIIPAAASFAAVPYLARTLGAAGYGHYVLYATTILLLVAVGGTWADQGAVRFCGEAARTGFPRSLLRSLAVVLLAEFIAVVVLAMSAAGVFSSLSWYPALLVSIASGSMMLVNVYSSCLRAEERFGAFTLVAATAGVARVGVAVVLVAAGLGATGAVAGWSIAAAVVAVLCLSRVGAGRFDRRTCVRVARYGVPLTLVGVGTLGLMLIDRFLIGTFVGADAVGVYSLGYTIADQSIILFTSIMMLPAFPRFVRAYDDGGETAACTALTASLVRWMWVAPPLAAFVVAERHPLVQLLGGGEFERAASIVPVVVAGSLVYSAGQYLAVPFQLRQRSVRYGAVVALALLVNVVLNLVLIPRDGIVGAAWATFGAYAVFAILAGLEGVHLTLLRPIARASIAMAAWTVPLAVVAPQTENIPLLGVLAGLFLLPAATFSLYAKGSPR